MHTYVVGFYGGTWLTEYVMRVSPEKKARSEACYRRYGSWTLVFSWLPVIGDPICLVGGALKVDWKRFVVLVCAGKLVRYAALAWLFT